MLRTIGMASLGLVLLGMGASAVGQGPDPLVTGQGAGKIARPADTLRVQIDLLAKDKEPQQAVAKLKELREKASAKLIELSAAKESIKFNEPTINGPESNQQLQRMVMMRMRGGGFDEKKLAVLPVTVSVNVTADWPLSGTPEELLLRCYELRKKIKAADVNASKAAAELSPEEQELMEELSDDNSDLPGAGKPGEPQFSYVIKLTAQERAKALKEAYENARAAAQRLAEAAGAKMGAFPRMLSTAPNGTAQYQMAQYTMYQFEGEMPFRPAGPEENEAVGNQPTRIEYQVVLNAAFLLSN
jgi:uncharacterized protein YggE